MLEPLLAVAFYALLGLAARFWPFVAPEPPKTTLPEPAPQLFAWSIRDNPASFAASVSQQEMNSVVYGPPSYGSFRHHGSLWIEDAAAPCASLSVLCPPPDPPVRGVRLPSGEVVWTEIRPVDR